MKRYPVVILPGWLLGSNRFKPLVEAFKKAGHKAYIVDFPGFEQGDKVFKAWTLSDYATFLKNYLDTHKIAKAIFVGHSFGGRVGLKLLSENPEYAHALVLAGTPGYRMIPSGKFKFISITSKFGQAVMLNIHWPYFQEVTRKVFDILVGARDLSKLTGYMRQTFHNIVNEELHPYMESLTVPTLLIWGKKDGIVHISIAEKMQKTIKKSQLVSFENAMHNVAYKHPEQFVEKVVKFLENI